MAAGAPLLLAGARPTAPAASLTPVFATDFPDPFVLPYQGGYLAYATNATEFRANVQMARSTNLRDWTLIRTGDRLHDALPELPAWAAPGRTWAPEVIATGGRYVLYFTAQERRSGLQCVGVATAQDPMGPFRSPAPAPLVCQRALGGTIDPSPWRDADGRLYLYFKSDGNNPAVLKPSRIWVQRLSDDGLSFVGAPRALIRNTRYWEWRVVESPAMVRRPDGGYVLLFSANHYGWEADQRVSNYAIGYATCEGPLGPCRKARENPILKSRLASGPACLSGPGHQTVFTDRGRQYVAFHAWSATTDCRSAGKGRFMYVAPLDWREGRPVIGAGLPRASVRSRSGTARRATRSLRRSAGSADIPPAAPRRAPS